MSEYRGTVATWHDDKGYGSITARDSDARIFVHINDCSRRHKRPVAGLPVLFHLGKDANGRARALDVRPSRGHRRVTRSGRQRRWSLLLGLGFFAGLYALVQLGRLPDLIPVFYLALSILTLILYGEDKWAAQSGRRRTPENTLHILSLLGGWPGAAIAQSFMRHKSSKQSFRKVYWLTVCLNLAALVYGLTPEGTPWLELFNDWLNDAWGFVGGWL